MDLKRARRMILVLSMTPPWIEGNLRTMAPTMAPTMVPTPAGYLHGMPLTIHSHGTPWFSTGFCASISYSVFEIRLASRLPHPRWKPCAAARPPPTRVLNQRKEVKTNGK